MNAAGVTPQRGRILTHICCAPCATYTVNRLRQIGFDVTGFWYNPNIHPWQEHERRRAALESYAGRIGLPMIWRHDYDFVEFLRRAAGQEQFRRRCTFCYEMRLTETARMAHTGGFDAFTTTLLISPYQDQGLLRQMGESLGRAEGVPFYFEDFRRGWAERGRLTKEYDLYRQQYCGCIYSEWERYNDAHIGDA
jgi:predicted adenine nucleotide alpha hydrolase (AANH) superfamily ATPase